LKGVITDEKALTLPGGLPKRTVRAFRRISGFRLSPLWGFPPFFSEARG
jgi:hypothetical protein